MIPTVYSPASFTGNNSAATKYVCNFKSLSVADLRVIAIAADGTESAVLSNGSGITVTLNGNTTEFTTTAVYDSTYEVVAYLAMDFLQSKDLQNSDNNDVNVREEMFDRLTLFFQIALAGVTTDRGVSIEFPTSDVAPTSTLPTPANRASSLIEFDASGNMTTLLKTVLFQQMRDFLTTGEIEDAISNTVQNLSTNLTLAASNSFRTLRTDASSGDITITCPQDSDATIEIGTKWDFTLLSSANRVVFAQGTGATIQSAVGTAPKISDQHGAATVQKVAANTYLVVGRINS